MLQHDGVHPGFPRHFPQPSGRAAILAFLLAGHTPDLALALGPAFGLPLGFAAGFFIDLAPAFCLGFNFLSVLRVG